MRKRNNRELEFQTMNKKILSGVFATKTNTKFFACGDAENNLLIYNTHRSSPLTILNSQTSNVSEITSLIFANNEDQVVAGSNRGSINVWDLNTLTSTPAIYSVSYCLKGHTVQVGCFAIDTNHQNILASGSYDTNVKLWDLRNKACIHVLKEHNGQIKSLALTPDSRYILSGSEDGFIKFWDIKMFRPVYDYECGTPVRCLQVHKKSMMFAAGCNDRMARLYQLNAPYNLLGATKNQTMPVVSCKFYKQGFLFTSALDSLKLWSIKKGCGLVDNIESSCKGVIDMHVGDDQTQQICFSGGVLSLHACKLEDVNFTGRVEESPNLSYNKVSQSSIEQERRPGGNVQRNNSIKKPPERRNISVSKAVVQDVQRSISNAVSSVQKLQDVFPRKGEDGAELFKLMEEHSKFMNIMSVRARTIEKVLDLWSMRNIKAIISILKDAQIYVVADVLTQIMKPCKYSIGLDLALVIANSSKEMIMAKHMTLIKSGLTFLGQLLGMFREEIIKVKTYPLDKSGVDFSREERLRGYDALIQVLIEVYNHPKLKKLLSKKQELCRLAQNLYNDLSYLFKKIFNNQQHF